MAGWVIRMPAGCRGTAPSIRCRSASNWLPVTNGELAGVLALKGAQPGGQLIRVSELVSRRDEVAPSYIMHRTCSPW